jgi:hypothetical protein
MKTSTAITQASLATLIAASSADAYYSNASFTFSDSSGTSYSWYVDNTSILLATFVHHTMGNSKYLELLHLNTETYDSQDGLGMFAGNGNSSILALNAGANITGHGSTLQSGICYIERNLNSAGAAFLSASGFTSGTPAYIGFKFTYNSETYYGWAKVTFTTGGTYGSVTVSEWSCSTNASFLVGEIDYSGFGSVPEPADAALGLGTLALGAAGLRRWRKHKTAKAA